MSKAKLLVYYRAPASGTLLSGNPDVESLDLPDDEEWKPGDFYEVNGRRIQITGRKVRVEDGVREVSYVCREYRLWEITEVVA